MSWLPKIGDRVKLVTERTTIGGKIIHYIGYGIVIKNDICTIESKSYYYYYIDFYCNRTIDGRSPVSVKAEQYNIIVQIVLNPNDNELVTLDYERVLVFRPERMIRMFDKISYTASCHTELPVGYVTDIDMDYGPTFILGISPFYQQDAGFISAQHIQKYRIL